MIDGHMDPEGGLSGARATTPHDHDQVIVSGFTPGDPRPTRVPLADRAERRLSGICVESAMPEALRKRVETPKRPQEPPVPPTGTRTTTIARDRRFAAGPVTNGLAVIDPVSRDHPRDCSPSWLGSSYRPLRADLE
jgi:hypothetical protein